MKTLVIFRLPGTGHAYLYCSADELVVLPHPQQGYEWNDRLYTAVRVYECLNKPGSNSQVMKLLKIFERTDEGVVSALSNMVQVGKAPLGGLVTVSFKGTFNIAQDIVMQHEAVLLVRLVADEVVLPESPSQSLAEALDQVSKNPRRARKLDTATKSKG